MTTTADENAALVRRFLVDTVGAGDRAAVDVFLADAAAVTDPVFGLGPSGWSAATVGDPDVDVRSVVATADQVAVRGRVSGTFHGPPCEGRAPGCRFDVAQRWFCRVEAGRIVSLWRLPDGLGLWRQLGSAPDHPLLDDRGQQP